MIRRRPCGSRRLTSLGNACFCVFMVTLIVLAVFYFTPNSQASIPASLKLQKQPPMEQVDDTEDFATDDDTNDIVEYDNEDSNELVDFVVKDDGVDDLLQSTSTSSWRDVMAGGSEEEEEEEDGADHSESIDLDDEDDNEDEDIVDDATHPSTLTKASADTVTTATGSTATVTGSTPTVTGSTPTVTGSTATVTGSTATGTTVTGSTTKYAKHDGHAKDKDKEVDREAKEDVETEVAEKVNESETLSSNNSAIANVKELPLTAREIASPVQAATNITEDNTARLADDQPNVINAQNPHGEELLRDDPINMLRKAGGSEENDIRVDLSDGHNMQELPPTNSSNVATANPGLPSDASSADNLTHNVPIELAGDNESSMSISLEHNVPIELADDEAINESSKSISLEHNVLIDMTGGQQGDATVPAAEPPAPLMDIQARHNETILEALERVNMHFGTGQTSKEDALNSLVFLHRYLSNVTETPELAVGKAVEDSGAKENTESGSAEQEAKRPKTPPNIVILMASDLGWGDVGYHGSDIRTPNLDALAKAGVRMDNHYVQDSSTGTRSNLLTGKYQIHTTLQHEYIRPDVPTGLPVSIPTLPQKLKEQDYATKLVGKWHLGLCEKEYLPTRRGFDYFYGFLGGSEGYYSHDYCGPAFGGTCGHDLWLNELPVNDTSTYSTHMYTRRAQDLIEGHALQAPDTPLFLMVSFQAVASPLEVPEAYERSYAHISSQNRRLHSGMVSCLDEAVGNITKSLKDSGLWDNTVLLFLTDNGGSLYHGSRNYPYRGGKGDLWEGGLRGVALVAGPLVLKPGFVSQEFVHVSDWFPTLLWLAGVDDEDMTLDGLNVWQAASGVGSSPRIDLLHNIDPIFKPRIGDVLPEHEDIFDTTLRAAYRYGDWKILTGCPYSTETAPSNLFQNIWLYNIRDDPEEMTNVAFHHPQTVAALLMRLGFFLKNSTAVWYPEPDARAHPNMNGGLIRPWRT